MSTKERRSYDPEFKKDAVRLSNEPGRTVAEVSDLICCIGGVQQKEER
jgi:transposase-like protein